MGKAKKKKDKKKKDGAQTKSGKATVAVNRKARFDYKLGDEIVAGIVLQGTEVKSLRNGQANLRGSFVRFIKGEPYLFNCHISEYKYGNIQNHAPTRDRKLLLKEREITWLQEEIQQKNHTVVPTKIFFKGNWAKVVLAIAEGKKQFDKRADMKKSAQDKEMRQALKRFKR